tara:strand:- start:328 stop:771 length:444 start_codon:yes stop_codon:yes gene_type:complete
MIKYNQSCDPNLRSPNKKIVKKITLSVMKKNRIKQGYISLIFGTDNLLFNIKKNFFNKEELTDVIAFRLNNYEDPCVEGEIYISLPRAKENSEIYNEPFPKEVCRLIIHGSLHLLGFEDNTKKGKEIMRSKEDFFLKGLQWELLFSN